MSPENRALLELFRAHGVEAIDQGEWISFPKNGMRARAFVVQADPVHDETGILLKVDLEIASGTVIQEWFESLGRNRSEAVADALRCFADSVFHVLLAVFFLPEDERIQEQVFQDEWIIGGQTRQVTMGNAVAREVARTQSYTLRRWCEPFQEKLASRNLGPGMHWLKLFYAHGSGKTLVCEVLRDNEEWPEMEEAMAAVDWVYHPDYYSLRLFVIIDGKDYANTDTPAVENSRDNPDEAVQTLIKTVMAHPHLSLEETCRALGRAGISERLARRAVSFTQSAWGRRALEGMGIHFSPEYICLDANGNVIESGAFADEPCFAAAVRLCPQHIRLPVFRFISSTSSEVNLVNEAQRQGYKPENLFLSPTLIFLEDPTEVGVEKRRALTAQQSDILKENIQQQEPPSRRQ